MEDQQARGGNCPLSPYHSPQWDGRRAQATSNGGIGSIAPVRPTGQQTFGVGCSGQSAATSASPPTTVVHAGLALAVRWRHAGKDCEADHFLRMTAIAAQPTSPSG